MKFYIVYDDTVAKSDLIKDIVGDTPFGDIVVQKKRLEMSYKENLLSIFKGAEWVRVNSIYEFNELISKLDGINDDQVKIIHAFSNFVIFDQNQAKLSFKKIEFMSNNYKFVIQNRIGFMLFVSLKSYISYLSLCIKKGFSNFKNELIDDFPNVPIDGMVDISNISSFIQCVTGNFDSRYFNSLDGDDYIIVKNSKDIKKIKSEYTFYHLLPDDMKYWFVMPFNYKEIEGTASYTMERLHMTDLAIKWVHGSMTEEEFSILLDKYFYFFKSRHCRECSIEVYTKNSNSLYVDKINQRLEILSNLKEFKPISNLISIVPNLHLEALKNKYFELKEIIERKAQIPLVEVIGHGDPCFSNALYNKSTKTLKFIDPKGALDESHLWTDPYYDIAKLSHSICGNYDFFNNALFEIVIDSNFDFNLLIPFDNSKFKEIFKEKVTENGYDYRLVRIYEASLFLSMLPLHIDNPHKVFGFILNVRKILKEIENEIL